MFEEFFNYLKNEKRYAANTLIAYKNDLSQFQAYLKFQFNLIEPAAASPVFIRSWMVSLMEETVSPTSINRKISALKTYYKFLLINGEISKNPMLKIQAPKNAKRLPSFVEQKSILKLFDEENFSADFEGQRDKVLLLILYATGIRLSELINIRLFDIDKQNGYLKVLGKGNKERYVPLNDRLICSIDNYKLLRETKHSGINVLLLTNKAKKMYPKFVYNTVKKYLNLVTTIEKKSPHVLRHSFATHLSNSGADLNDIKELLGHASLAATQIYTHNSIEKLKKIHKQAHPKS